MRLIDVNTFELKEFLGTKTPPYAILSHAWGDEEVTFQEWEHRNDPVIQRKAGYVKIAGACRRARADKLKYLWCDTNCINKTSSEELTEAINSMFAWYHDSVICYAYLYDVKLEEPFAKSRWWTRGWTLQELLAPKSVVFFNRHWAVLGDKGGLASSISDVARIHIGALKDRETIRDYSIAQRMSWAANRETSRKEDIAYCLLGIFDINMPLLYGEGQKAFNRLQREIIKVSNDQSILAWDLQHSDDLPWTSALATSPTNFRFCGSVVKNNENQRSAYSITNLGISMKVSLVKTAVKGIVFVRLNCVRALYKQAIHSRLPDGAKLPRQFQIWIPLLHLRHDTFARLHHPSSKVFFQQLYEVLSCPMPTNLFLSLEGPRSYMERPRTTAFKTLMKHSTNLPSGVLVMLGSGKVTLGGHILKEMYPLGETSLIQLKSRSPSTASHQLVSCGNLSVIISVFWAKNGSSQDWLYTTFFDPELKFTREMASQGKWNCFFEGPGHTQSDECCNSAAAMHLLHNKLRHAYGSSLDAYVKESMDPVVSIESTLLEDLFGQPELILELIFRESPTLNRIPQAPTTKHLPPT
ncbi:HET-domain-containing protein [Hypoxylon rubiginosum]|uniref:HET-domain-containing protein n=1 Tax=Hypoxylon rubiginosum TaxID=110542 RepID=A0ACC0CMZ8_9PEZI|nr:HET-domain-containing protein [Hypoxylon rubiginosum]